MLYRPVTDVSKIDEAWVKLYTAGQTRNETSEADYFYGLRSVYNFRNPHAMVGEEAEEGEADFEELPPEDDPQS